MKKNGTFLIPLIVLLLMGQATATSPPAPNWATKYPQLLEGVSDLLKHPERYTPFEKPEYTATGPLGIPTLKFIIPGIEYAPRVTDAGTTKPREQSIAPALSACALLDLQAGQVGAWGPECRIAKILQKPIGKLVPDTRENALYGDYRYTPRRAGIDTMRFILENGAGKQVDVTIKIPALLSLPEIE